MRFSAMGTSYGIIVQRSIFNLGGSTMLVKVAPMGGVVIEVNVADGSTAEQAISASGISVGDREIKLNGRTIESNEVLHQNGSALVLVLTPKVKGGTR
jgi:hypothetical protein